MAETDLREKNQEQPCTSVPSESTSRVNGDGFVCLDATNPSSDTSEKNNDAPAELAFTSLSGAHVPEFDGFDPNSEAVRRVRWKVDRRLITMLSLIYLCCYLDRANLGRIRIAFMYSSVI